MEAKAALVVALAREMIVDARRGRRGGPVVSDQLRLALGRSWRLATPGGPLGHLGVEAGQNGVQAADAEEQQLLGRGRQRGEIHLQRCCLVFECRQVVDGAFMMGVRKAIS